MQVLRIWLHSHQVWHFEENEALFFIERQQFLLGPAAEQQQTNKKKVKILLLGRSLLFGFCCLCQSVAASHVFQWSNMKANMRQLDPVQRVLNCSLSKTPAAAQRLHNPVEICHCGSIGVNAAYVWQILPLCLLLSYLFLCIFCGLKNWCLKQMLNCYSLLSLLGHRRWEWSIIQSAEKLYLWSLLRSF